MTLGVTRIVVIERVADRAPVVLRGVVNAVHLDGGRGPRPNLTRSPVAPHGITRHPQHPEAVLIIVSSRFRLD